MVDWDRVDELKAEIGVEDFQEVVELFLGEVDEVVERLRTSPDTTMLEADLHSLRSSALNIGFSAFAARCGAGELAAAAGSPVDLGPIMEIYDESRLVFARGSG
ncbi:Hpt domain-containing protein [Maritimibacter sp. UBA3975]|uniref:Hpt domain-containing protein n=1 Tax=Maritimibacter sp. UBA3975 TaxID=1946833 RepID=UPI000C0A05CC|nr:Hpt domain-containing protein [Maritimibacter sp. UBA3975]MAM63422.1 histidine kinase [Maritimibacter sp.]|tara:strand:- start:56809 stop:57120 length:312 start_codon:yes stop_codon:yes gene_type:complete